MNQITQMYKTRCEMLQEQIHALKQQLELIEDVDVATAEPETKSLSDMSQEELIAARKQADANRRTAKAGTQEYADAQKQFRDINLQIGKVQKDLDTAMHDKQKAYDYKYGGEYSFDPDQQKKDLEQLRAARHTAGSFSARTHDKSAENLGGANWKGTFGGVTPVGEDEKISGTDITYKDWKTKYGHDYDPYNKEDRNRAINYHSAWPSMRISTEAQKILNNSEVEAPQIAPESKKSSKPVLDPENKQKKYFVPVLNKPTIPETPMGQTTMRTVLKNRYGSDYYTNLAIDTARDYAAKNPVSNPEFNFPDYSDENLDKPIYVVSVAGISSTGAGGNPVGGDSMQAVPGQPGHIRIARSNPSIGDVSQELQTGSVSSVQAKNKSLGYVYDILSHEALHAIQPMAYTPPRTRQFPRYNPTDGVSERVRKAYTQNPQEPAARTAELKHTYFGETGIPITANSSQEEWDAFLKWVEKKSLNRKNMQDVLEILRSSQGRDLANRIARMMPRQSDTMQA